MADYEQIKKLNDRSRMYNGPQKAIYLTDVAGESKPTITYRPVNTKQKADYKVSILDFIAKLVALEFYAVNIEAARELFDCYDVIANEPTVKAAYGESTGILSVFAYGARIADFQSYEYLDEDAVENITKKVIGAFGKYRIPLGSYGKDIIENEVKRCIDEEISQHRPMQVADFSLEKWFEDDEDFFTLE